MLKSLFTWTNVWRKHGEENITYIGRLFILSIIWWYCLVEQKTPKYCSTYNIQLRLSAILIHDVSSFWIVTVLSNHIFVTRSPQRLSSRPLNLPMVLDKPFLRTYATVLVVPCISHACTSTRPNDFQMRFPLCIVPLFFSLFPATNTYSYSQ